MEGHVELLCVGGKFCAERRERGGWVEVSLAQWVGRGISRAVGGSGHL